MKSTQNIIRMTLILGFLFFNQLLAQSGTVDPTITIRKASTIDQRKSGDNQYNLTGNTLNDPIVVRVLSGSEPLADYPVHFSLIASPKKA